VLDPMVSPPEQPEQPERRDTGEEDQKKEEEERKRKEEESWEGVGSNDEASRQSRRFLEPEPARDVTTASIHPDEVCAH
jgi:hypothetical protein